MSHRMRDTVRRSSSTCSTPRRLYRRGFSLSALGWQIQFPPFTRRKADRPKQPDKKRHVAGISVTKPGFEQRTFECATCHRIEKVSIPIDPLKIDAIGWMASELKPPH
jgi:hypothetical protein